MNVRLIYIAALLWFTGCGTPVFQKVYPVDATTGQPLTNQPPVGVIVSPGTAATLQAIKTGAETIPSPVSPFVALAASLAAGVLAEIARRKTSQLTASQSALSSVIQGVELTGHQPTKDSIARFATASGAETALAPMVKTVQDRLATLKTDPSSPKS